MSKLKQKSTTNENVFTILDELIKTSCIEVDNLIEVDILDSFELIDLKSDNIINILKKIKSDLEGYEKEFDENTDDSDQSKLLLTEIEKLDNDLNQIEKIYKPLKIKFKKLTEKLAIYSKNKK